MGGKSSSAPLLENNDAENADQKVPVSLFFPFFHPASARIHVDLDLSYVQIRFLLFSQTSELIPKDTRERERERERLQSMVSIVDLEPFMELVKPTVVETR